MSATAVELMTAETFSWVLTQWCRNGNHCVGGVESGFILRRDLDPVRSPDVFIVCADRMPADGVAEAFWNQAPDLPVLPGFSCAVRDLFDF
jgi:hypothetical protein